MSEDALSPEGQHEACLPPVPPGFTHYWQMILRLRDQILVDGEFAAMGTIDGRQVPCLAKLLTTGECAELGMPPGSARITGRI